MALLRLIRFHPFIALLRRFRPGSTLAKFKMFFYLFLLVLKIKPVLLQGLAAAYCQRRTTAAGREPCTCREQRPLCHLLHRHHLPDVFHLDGDWSRGDGQPGAALPLQDVANCGPGRTPHGALSGHPVRVLPRKEEL
jgi:hypothetical protein